MSSDKEDNGCGCILLIIIIAIIWYVGLGAFVNFLSNILGVVFIVVAMLFFGQILTESEHSNAEEILAGFTFAFALAGLGCGFFGEIIPALFMFGCAVLMLILALMIAGVKKLRGKSSS